MKMLRDAWTLELARKFLKCEKRLNRKKWGFYVVILLSAGVWRDIWYALIIYYYFFYPSTIYSRYSTHSERLSIFIYIFIYSPAKWIESQAVRITFVSDVFHLLRIVLDIALMAYNCNVGRHSGYWLRYVICVGFKSSANSGKTEKPK